jgi:hypothetical protein
MPFQSQLRRGTYEYGCVCINHLCGFSCHPMFQPFSDFNFIFSILMECERSCTALGSSTDISKAQNTFLSSVVSSFTTEAFHVLRCYLTISSNVKTVTNLLLRAQKFVDAGEVVARRGCREQDYREKQGMLSVSSFFSDRLN